jgi:hypothetical protein
MQDQRWKHTLSQASYPTLTSVLLTLQVAICGHVRTRRVWGGCKVKLVLLRRRCSLEGKIWWLNKMQLRDRKTKLNKCSKKGLIAG